MAIPFELRFAYLTFNEINCGMPSVAKASTIFVGLNDNFPYLKLDLRTCHWAW